MTFAQTAILIAAFHVAGIEARIPERPTTSHRSAIDEVRPEIRRRLVFFQSCAAAASRRGVLGVRRLDVTWTIAADGSVQAITLAGVMDPGMAACLARVGSRRFPMPPGTELVIPVPVVFLN